MSELHLELGVIVARRVRDGEWSWPTWRPVAVIATAPPLETGAHISNVESDQLYYAGAWTLSLHASETRHYRDNLQSGRPAIWVALTSGANFPLVHCVTADPYEGEALGEIYGEGLDAVAMPAVIRDEVARFVSAHHVERPFVKRKRT